MIHCELPGCGALFPLTRPNRRFCSRAHQSLALSRTNNKTDRVVFPVTRNTIQDILEAKAAGYSIHEIATATGRSQKLVWEVFHHRHPLQRP